MYENASCLKHTVRTVNDVTERSPQQATHHFIHNNRSTRKHTSFTVGTFSDIIDGLHYIYPNRPLIHFGPLGSVKCLLGCPLLSFFVSIWEFLFKTCRIKTPFGVFNFNSTTMIHLESLRQPCNFFTNIHFSPNKFRIFPPHLSTAVAWREKAFCL